MIAVLKNNIVIACSFSIEEAYEYIRLQYEPNQENEYISALAWYKYSGTNCRQLYKIKEIELIELA